MDRKVSAASSQAGKYTLYNLSNACSATEMLLSYLRPNSITLSRSQTWSHTCSELNFWPITHYLAR